MEEVVKALAPWPVLQGIVIGLLVAAAAFWAMRRGLQENRRREGLDVQPIRLHLTDDEKKAQWAAYEQLQQICENSFAVKHHLEKMVEGQSLLLAALNRLSDSRWNKGQ